MKPVYLFLPDFRSFIINTKFKSAEDPFPVFHHEGDRSIRFYKYLKGVWFATAVSTKAIQSGITFADLTREFTSFQLPSRPDAPGTVTVSI